METKVCKTCKIMLPVNEFPVANIQLGKVYRKTVCRPCWSKSVMARRKAKAPPPEIMPPSASVNVDYSKLINSIVRPLPCQK